MTYRVQRRTAYSLFLLALICAAMLRLPEQLPATRFIIGLAMSVFIPGFIWSVALFRRIGSMERIGFSVLLSCSSDIFVGTALGLLHVGLSAFTLSVGICALSLVPVATMTGTWVRVREDRAPGSDDRRQKRPMLLLVLAPFLLVYLAVYLFLNARQQTGQPSLMLLSSQGLLQSYPQYLQRGAKAAVEVEIANPLPNQLRGRLQELTGQGTILSTKVLNVPVGKTIRVKFYMPTAVTGERRLIVIFRSLDGRVVRKVSLDYHVAT